MFFADEPYISDFFKSTVRDHNIPIVDTAIVKGLGLYANTNLITESDAAKSAGEISDPLIYTTSENAIGWISQNLSSTNLPSKIDLFKNKFIFRKLIHSMFPDFFFKEIHVDKLDTLIFNELALPFIIKPTIGFFSMGVYKVSSEEEWNKTKFLIKSEMAQFKNLYPSEVLDTNSFIIEECIEGDEFAVDAYFNAAGEPVILSILHHTFSSDADVSDRVYTTSKDIIENNIEGFTEFLKNIGKLSEVKNFAVHAELRRDIKGNILPIEVNPMRFGGWCTTADITFRAYGFNPYLYFYNQQKPDWQKVLENKDGKLYSIVVLDNSTGVKTENILSFNYDKVLKNFENPLELRKIDVKKYKVFGFLFVETKEDNFEELKKILDSDLSEFITVK